jgi:hypothetical protein
MQTLLVGFCLSWIAPAAEIAPADVQAVLSVEPNAVGHREAAEAWPRLADAPAAQLPVLLAALDEANPLAANWLLAAIEASLERSRRQGATLPVDELHRFLANRKHAPRARRLAYEMIVEIEPAARERLLAGMIDDPSLELRRDAVAQLIERVEAMQKEQADVETMAARYGEALAAARDMDQINSLAARLRALGKKVDLPRHFGLIVDWRLIGPFDNVGGVGFDAVYPPERVVDFDQTLEGKRGPVKWIEHSTSDAYGQVDLNKALGEEKGVVAYAAADFVSDAEWQVEIRYASFGATKLWLNGQSIAAIGIYHSGTQFDQYVARGTLRPGRNLILLKACQNEQQQDWARDWGFQLRVCDEAGGAVLSKERQ